MSPEAKTANSSLDAVAAADLLDVVPDGVLVIDENGEIIAANPAIERLFGYEQGELEGEPLALLIPERYHGLHAEHRLGYQADPRARPMGEELDLWARRKDGTEFAVEIALGPIRHGSLTCTVAVIRDISEHHRQLAELQSQHDHRTAIFDALFAGLAETDRSGRIADVSPRFCEMVGFSREEILAMQPPYEFWPENLEDHEHGHTRTLLKRPDGTSLQIEASAAPIRSSQGEVTGRIYLLLDVSDTVRMSEQLRAAQTKIVLLEDRDRIARDLHDLVIQRVLATGMSLQAIESALPDSWTISRVREAVSELDEVISELRGVIFGLNRYSPDLRQAVRETVTASSRGLPRPPELSFQGDFGRDFSDEMVLHATAVTRELLSNVVRHAEAENVEVIVSASELLKIHVIDDGRGLDRDGTPGNGLVNLGQRAEVLGGSMEIYSEADGGTTVEWSVPIEVPSVPTA